MMLNVHKQEFYGRSGLAIFRPSPILDRSLDDYRCGAV